MQNQPTRGPLRHLFAVAAFAAMTACAGAPKRTFYVKAIDTNEDPVPCLVVVGNDWGGAATARQIVNINGADKLAVDVTFEVPEVTLMCAAIRTNTTTGEPDSLPTSRNESTEQTGFLGGARRLRVDDAPTVLFILERKPER